MRIRVLQALFYAKHKRNYVPGDVADIPKDEAKIWLESGLAMQDKSLDGPKENKSQAGK